jgi:hypothetical protein
VLSRYRTIEAIPDRALDWDVDVRGAKRLAAALAEARADAALFKVLATLRTDADVGGVDSWEWRGPTDDFAGWAERLGQPALATRAEALATSRAAGRGGRR